MAWSVVQSDAIDFLRGLPAGSVDLVFGSPPYELARSYFENGQNLGIARKTPQWVEWMADVHETAQRACKGLVAFVVAGQTKGYRWTAGPALYIAELHRRGLNLRNPPIFSRVGIPGSGGPDWLRADYEWIVCTTPPGKMVWSDNTACGHPPKWIAGGEMSNRQKNGQRKNAFGVRVDTAVGTRPTGNKNGDVEKYRGKHFRHSEDPTSPTAHDRDICAVANPGNVQEQTYTFTASQLAELLTEAGDVGRHIVGGGVMGHPLAHENEAPFPLSLAEFYVRSFAPPGGLVLDPFAGSGTTGHACVLHGRDFLGCDLRESQVTLTRRRLEGVTPGMFV